MSACSFRRLRNLGRISTLSSQLLKFFSSTYFLLSALESSLIVALNRTALPTNQTLLQSVNASSILSVGVFGANGPRFHVPLR
jgi:hypothetical protein